MAKPTHNVYVNVGGSNSKMKLKIGAVFKHDKGDGFNIVLNANPIDGRMVAFPIGTEDDHKDTVEPSS